MLNFIKDLVLICGALAGVVCLALAILKLIDRLTLGPRATKEERDEIAKEFERRLRNPDFAALEKHFGHPMPPALIALYGNAAELQRSDFEVAATVDADEDERYFIMWYNPADPENLESPWPGTERYFHFADDGCGNPYLVDPSLPDPPVIFYDHETGETQEVCGSLSEFMRWPRFEPDAPANPKSKI